MIPFIMPKRLPIFHGFKIQFQYNARTCCQAREIAQLAPSTEKRSTGVQRGKAGVKRESMQAVLSAGRVRSQLIF